MPHRSIIRALCYVAIPACYVGGGEPGPTTATITRADLVDDACWLARLYDDALGRAIDPAGQAHWSAQLEDGAPRATVAAGVLDSDEWRHRFVERSYRLLLRRAPDPGGQADWVAAMQRGATTDAVLVELVASLEYWQQIAGADRRTWVGRLYLDLLGREPAGSELDDWLARAGELAGDPAARRAVARGFVDSPEYHRRVLADAYARYLHRGVDSVGLAGHAAALDAGATETMLAVALVTSDEYLAACAEAEASTDADVLGTDESGPDAPVGGSDDGDAGGDDELVPECAGDGDCVALDDGVTPYCVASWCVECRSDADCAASSCDDGWCW